MSGNPVLQTGGIYTHDFSASANGVFGGSNGHKELAPGVWGMRSGDANADKQVNNSDKVDHWSPQAGGSGYLRADFNLDSQCGNQDKLDYWEVNSGNSSQVPY